jgi:hypothetical protein
LIISKGAPLAVPEVKQQSPCLDGSDNYYDYDDGQIVGDPDEVVD